MAIMAKKLLKYSTVYIILFLIYTDISDGIDNFMGIKWWMICCLALAWFIVYLIIMKGIQSSGYVVYFTALFPYIVMTIFLVRGLTLPGSGAGLKHMFWPKVSITMKLIL